MCLKLFYKCNRIIYRSDITSTQWFKLEFIN